MVKKEKKIYTTFVTGSSSPLFSSLLAKFASNSPSHISLKLSASSSSKLEVSCCVLNGVKIWNIDGYFWSLFRDQ